MCPRVFVGECDQVGFPVLLFISADVCVCVCVWVSDPDLIVDLLMAESSNGVWFPDPAREQRNTLGERENPPSKRASPNRSNNETVAPRAGIGRLFNLSSYASGVAHGPCSVKKSVLSGGPCLFLSIPISIDSPPPSSPLLPPHPLLPGPAQQREPS